MILLDGTTDILDGPWPTVEVTLVDGTPRPRPRWPHRWFCHCPTSSTRLRLRILRSDGEVIVDTDEETLRLACQYADGNRT